jgi:tripartite-type tricarboxylate transporter receptor subunit TctC
MSRIFTAFLIAIWGLTACQPGGSSSQNYPNKPITLIVPWAPGGGTDLTSRTFAVALQKAIGQPVNVVNRTGGGGVVGHLAINMAPADGYTLGAVTVEISMLRHLGLTELSYADYTPLARLVSNSAAITVKEDAPWQNLNDFVADLKAKPGQYQASGTARGGIWDLARAGFLQTADLPESALPWVPSQGAAPALQELIAGGVDVVTAALSEVSPLRQAGQVRTLGVMADERSAAFPEVPTLKEQGIDWAMGAWISVGAPAGLPAEVKAVLDSAINVAVQDPDYQAAIQKTGMNLQYLAGEEFQTFMYEQDSINGALMRSAGLTPNQ